VSMTTPQIPISAVRFGAEEERLVLEVLRSGRLAQGPMVERFEAEMARLHGVRHAVAVSNGTVALVAALQALDLRPGDEVVTSPFTFVATLNAVIEAGATARFADIDPDDYTVDVNAMAAAVGERTRVLLPVHLYGQPAAMTGVGELAARHGLAVVEDAAQAHGAAVGGRPVGGWGLGCFSFYATKNVTTGEGGIVTTNDDALADRLRILRNQGMRQRYQYELAGHNYRMTELQAAIGVAQLGRLAELDAARQANAARLTALLEGTPGLVLPRVQPGRTHAWHQYTVALTAAAACDRDDLAERLSGLGIASGVYYPRTVFDYECYADHPQVVIEPMPHAEQAARNVLSLPVHPGLSDADLERIGDAVRSCLAG
jgi:perosamine synthetase